MTLPSDTEGRMNIEDRLIELAEKATDGPWGLTIDEPPAPTPHRIALSPDARKDDEIALFPSRPDRADDAAYIAAASPSTILALANVVKAARAFHDHHGRGGGPFSKPMPIPLKECNDPRCHALAALDALKEEK